MPMFTVIGMYEDDNQTFTDVIHANNALEAMRLSAITAHNPTLIIVGAIKGDHQIIAPCEDTGTAAYSTDVLGIDDNAAD